MKIPVLFIIFNRTETERVVFNRIREYRPNKLYVAADGPRENREDDRKKCQEARDIIKNVDWPCEVKTLFREKNVGCGMGVSSAITWFFEYEEYGAIIEDDVLPSVDFFTICEEALPKYRDEEKIMMITSFNPGSKLAESNKMGLTKYANIWAWAAWRRAWDKFDINMNEVSKRSLWDYIKWYGLILGIGMHHYKNFMLSSYKESGNWHAWDYQWSLSLFTNHAYSMAPYVNLTKNIGIGVGEGTHYSENDKDPYTNLQIGNIKTPLEYPQVIDIDKALYRQDIKEFIRMRKIGLKKKLKHLLAK